MLGRCKIGRGVYVEFLTRSLETANFLDISQCSSKKNCYSADCFYSTYCLVSFPHKIPRQSIFTGQLGVSACRFTGLPGPLFGAIFGNFAVRKGEELISLLLISNNTNFSMLLIPLAIHLKSLT